MFERLDEYENIGLNIEPEYMSKVLAQYDEILKKLIDIIIQSEGGEISNPYKMEQIQEWKLLMAEARRIIDHIDKRTRENFRNNYSLDHLDRYFSRLNQDRGEDEDENDERSELNIDRNRREDENENDDRPELNIDRNRREDEDENDEDAEDDRPELDIDPRLIRTMFYDPSTGTYHSHMRDNAT